MYVSAQPPLPALTETCFQVNILGEFSLDRSLCTIGGGTEGGDALAAPATLYSRDACFRVKEAFRTILELQIKDKPWKVSIQARLPDWPRRVAVASFRTATRHDCLGRHLHRLGILPTRQCILCNTTDDTCPSLSTTIPWTDTGRPGKR